MYRHSGKGTKHLDEGCLFPHAPQLYRRGRGGVFLPCMAAPARRLRGSCLAAAGCRFAAPGEYTRRAFLERQAGSDAVAEAAMDLISAMAVRGAALANAVLGGALAKKISAQKEAFTAIQAHLAVWGGFSYYLSLQVYFFAEIIKEEKALKDLEEYKKFESQIMKSNDLKNEEYSEIIEKLNH